MRIEYHKERLKEHESFLDMAIKYGIEKSQSSIGFHTSAGAVELLSILLRSRNIISEGKQINHRWFKSKRLVEENLPEFENKKRIVDLIYEIESKRDAFIYGVPRPIEEIKAIIFAFRKLKEEVLKEVIL